MSVDQQQLSVARTSELLFHIDRLSESQNSQVYFRDLLGLLVEYSTASSGHIWQMVNDEFVPMVQCADQEDRDAMFYDHERQSAQEVLRSGEVALEFTSPHDDATSHFQRCCLLTPLFDHERCFGVVSVNAYVASVAEAEQKLDTLRIAAAQVQKNFMFHYFANATSELRKLRKAKEVTDGISKYIETKPLAFEVVNRLCKYLKADRVSIAFKRGKSCKVQGISNQAVFDRRSGVVRRLEKLAAKIALIDEQVWYPCADAMAPSLQLMLDRYFEVSNTLSIAIIPLFAEAKRRDDPEDIAATIQSDEERRECVGVLILEGIDGPLPKEKILRRFSRVESFLSNSVSNARKYDGLFLMPVWRRLGVAADWYRGHTKRKAVLVSAAIVAVLLSLVLIPADFKLRGDGMIQPLQRQHVYAQTDGTVETLYFSDGQDVISGELLVELANPELATRIADLEGKLKEATQQLETVTLQRVTRAFDTEQEERDLVRTATTTKARVAGLAKQIELLRQSEAQLHVHSPMDGEVITWDTRQRLNGRPVKRGQRLLTVALPSGEWEVELRIPDKRTGYLLRQWNESQLDEKTIEASFVLASNPTDVYRGEVFEISPDSNVDDKEEENVVRVRVRLPNDEVAKLKTAKPGTTVIGHVHCGRASIGYCKLFEFFDWTSRIWFKFVS